MTSTQSPNLSDSSVAAVVAAARERCGMSSTNTPSTNQTHTCNSESPTGSNVSSIYDCIERAIGYGLEPPVYADPERRPPLETYRVTATEHGSIYRATDAFRTWFDKCYPIKGGDHRAGGEAARPTSQGVGGAEGSRKQTELIEGSPPKKRASWMT